ncbi:MAG: outer membrane protein assembly factor BamB family protein, partial [Kiritimatiellia bacterium]
MPPTILGPANQKRRRLAYEIALTAGIVTAIFALFIALVLVVGHVQLRAADPLNSVLLQKLRAELAAQPDNEELREQIRALDLLARRAYFANVIFLRNGLVLLLVAGSIAVIALSLSASLARQPPRPSRVQSDAAPYRDQQRARWILGISAATTALLVAVLIAATGPPPYLTQTRAGQQPPAPSPSTTPTPAVEPEATPPPSSLDILRNWPNFRGPCGNGIAFCTNAPTQWDVAQGIGIVWKRPVPRYGTSSPIVWGKRLFLTGGDAERREVFCYDAETGTLLWRGSGDGVPGEPTEPPEVSSDAGHAAPTPATDGRRVFAIFATGNLLCYDFDGRRLWARNLGPIENHYGHASSLLVREGRLIVQLDQGSGSKVLAFEATTGEPAWERLRWTISWASPICVDTGSRMELILAESKY